jgi:ABC-type iron transport system FetAB permease component
MLVQTLSCVGSSAGVFLCYTLLFVVRTQPWWAPQYFIPILGMMLGNSISGVSVGLSALLEDFNVGASVPSTLTHAHCFLLICFLLHPQISKGCCSL